MNELIKGLLAAPVATIFIIGGMLFLLVAVIGNISGKIEPGNKARIASAILGLVFIIVGSWMHSAQSVPTISASSATAPTLQSNQILEPRPTVKPDVPAQSFVPNAAYTNNTYQNHK